jgi:hypothetical protein
MEGGGESRVFYTGWTGSTVQQLMEKGTIPSVLQNNMGLNHIYQHKFYNSVILCENLLKKKKFVVPRRLNWGISSISLKRCWKQLNGQQSFIHRKGDILFQIWKDKWVMHMISTIHELKRWLGKKEAQLHFRIQLIHKRCKSSQSVPKLIFYPQKNDQMVQKFVLYLLNCALFSILSLKNFTQKKKQTTKFLHEVGGTWIT